MVKEILNNVSVVQGIIDDINQWIKNHKQAKTNDKNLRFGVIMTPLSR